MADFDPNAGPTSRWLWRLAKITEDNHATWGGSGVTDHGALTGLADDDHAQYLNSARHTAITGNPHGTTAAQVGADASGTAAAAVASHVAAGDPHTQYLLESAVSAFGLTLIDDADAAGARTTLGAAAASHAHPASDISDSTVAGRNMLTAADVAAQKALLAYTTGDIGAQPTDATLAALAGLDASAGLLEQTGADAFTKRAMGVGASTSVLTRADGDGRFAALSHTHPASQISDSTAAGRSMLTAADAAAQRALLSLGTGALVNITVSTTAPGSPSVGDLWVDTN